MIPFHSATVHGNRPMVGRMPMRLHLCLICVLGGALLCGETFARAAHPAERFAERLVPERRGERLLSLDEGRRRDGDRFGRDRSYDEGPQLPLDVVVRRIEQRSPGGRILNAERDSLDGRTVYRVRWATGDGRRIDYVVDARTGQILFEDR